MDMLVLGDLALKHRDALFLVHDLDLVDPGEYRHLLCAVHPQVFEEDGKHPGASLGELLSADVVRHLLGQQVLLQLVNSLGQWRQLLRGLHQLLDVGVLGGRLCLQGLLQDKLRAEGLPQLPNPKAILEHFVRPPMFVHDPQRKVPAIVLEAISLAHEPCERTSRSPLLGQQELHLVAQCKLDPIALGFVLSSDALLFLRLERLDEAVEGVEQVLLPAALEDLVPEHLAALVDHHPRGPEVPDVQVPVVIGQLILRRSRIVEGPRHRVELRDRVFGEHRGTLPLLPPILALGHGLAQLRLELVDLCFQQCDLVVSLVETLLQHRHDLLRRRISAGQHVRIHIACCAQDDDARLHLRRRATHVEVGGVGCLGTPVELGNASEQVGLQAVHVRARLRLQLLHLGVIVLILRTLRLVAEVLVPTPRVYMV
mmetsp:Transcript_33603/g.96484  ORF Transcript_33603/g.96484 Transcript_33603/m.96484 type:complete len:427 (-) Transcript_33603:123-1403(-)